VATIKVEGIAGMETESTRGGETAKGGVLGKWVGNQYVVLACRLILGLIFLLSAIGKLVDLQGSVDAVYSFNVFPLAFARFAGLVVPFIELLLALGLIFGVLTRLAALGASIMSISFFLVKAHVLFIQGRQVDCGCFGALMSTMASVTIYMDVPMLVMGLVIMAAPASARHWASLAAWASQTWKDKLRLVW
jgi:putative oxidoreductase